MRIKLPKVKNLSVKLEISLSLLIVVLLVETMSFKVVTVVKK